MRITVIALAFVPGAAHFIVPSRANAETGNEMACGQLADVQTGVASDVEVLSDGFDPDKSMKYFLDEIRLFNSADCKSENTSLYTVSFLDLWHAWLLHYANKSWRDALELAIQRLTKCTSIYYATDRGASCSTWQEKAVSWKVQWEESISP